ncbi:Stonin-1 [Manis pentadactyla]|nr:Stonin-1 [Manis pentadactyla]
MFVLISFLTVLPTSPACSSHGGQRGRAKATATPRVGRGGREPQCSLPAVPSARIPRQAPSSGEESDRLPSTRC